MKPKPFLEEAMPFPLKQNEAGVVNVVLARQYAGQKEAPELGNSVGASEENFTVRQLKMVTVRTSK